MSPISDATPAEGTRTGMEAGKPEMKTFLSSLAEQLEHGGRAATVFGEPVERDGVTIVPVARARWGLGGGQGVDAKGDRGQGGGGGVCATPVGYIEMKGGETRFRWIATPGSMLQLAFAALVGLMALRLLR